MVDEILIKEIRDDIEFNEKVVEIYYLSDMFKLAEILKKPLLKIKSLGYEVFYIIDGKTIYKKIVERSEKDDFKS